jgi:elongation factor G
VGAARPAAASADPDRHPGHIDFAIEVERSLRVLDGAVAVFSAVDGVQPQSETVWRQARRHRVPLIAFVNKMDRVGASFERVLEQLQDKLRARPWALGVPLGSESGFNGWVDLVDERVLQWQDGAAATVTPWDDAARAQWQPSAMRWSRPWPITMNNWPMPGWKVA